MLKKVYLINNKKLLVLCEIKEYEDIIKKRLLLLEETTINNYDYSIEIYNDKTIIKLDNITTINGKLLHTDIYPILFNTISNIVNDNNNILIHSVVLSHKNVGYLVVGDFGSSKTTLCIEALKNNFTIVSTDQTIISNSNNRINCKYGSRYMKIDKNNEKIVEHNNINIEIKYIINLMGCCDNGKTDIIKVHDKEIVIKTLFKYCTWHSNIPLFTDNHILNIDRIKIKNWLQKLKIPLYNVRGDLKQIIEEIKELK